MIGGGKHSRGISLANITLFISEKVPFSAENPVTYAYFPLLLFWQKLLIRVVFEY